MYITRPTNVTNCCLLQLSLLCCKRRLKLLKNRLRPSGPLLKSHCFTVPKVRCTWCKVLSAPLKSQCSEGTTCLTSTRSHSCILTAKKLLPEDKPLVPANCCEVVVAMPAVCITKELNRKSEVLLVKAELYYTNHWTIRGLVGFVGALLVEDKGFESWSFIVAENRSSSMPDLQVPLVAHVFNSTPSRKKEVGVFSSWSKMLPSVRSMISKSNAPKKIPCNLPMCAFALDASLCAEALFSFEVGIF